MKLLRLIWDQLELFLGSICLVVIVVVSSVNVFSRYILNAPILGATEISTILFIWLIMFGIAAAAKDKLHPQIDVHFSLLPEKGRLIARIIADLVMIILLTIFIIIGIRYMLSAGLGIKTNIFGIDYLYIYIALPIGFTLMLVRVLSKLLIDIRNLYIKRNKNMILN